VPNVVVLPFGVLNRLPAIDGIQDARFEIPTLTEIGDEIRANTLDRTQVDELVVRGAYSAIDYWWEQQIGTVDIIDEIIGGVVDAVEGATGVDVPGEGSVIDEVAGRLPGEREIERIIQEVLRGELDDAVLSETAVNIEGIFGPLGSDIEEGLSELIDFDPDSWIDRLVDRIRELLDDAIGAGGDVFDSLPTFDDVETIFRDVLDDVSPALNGANFWFDPLAFLREVWSVIEEKLVDPEVSADLREVIDTFGGRERRDR
jgi:hypothetical protein